jgi:Lrp/AsnC family leucine-responsive transcriptional regulator
VDPRALDQSLLAFIAVRSEGLPGDDAIGHQLARIAEVLEVHHIAGDDCFLLKVRARDTEHLGELLREKLGRIRGVRSTRTTIVLGSLKETSRLPVPGAAEVDVS